MRTMPGLREDREKQVWEKETARVNVAMSTGVFPDVV